VISGSLFIIAFICHRMGDYPVQNYLIKLKAISTITITSRDIPAIKE
jgi:hypothetical protein